MLNFLIAGVFSLLVSSCATPFSMKNSVEIGTFGDWKIMETNEVKPPIPFYVHKEDLTRTMCLVMPAPKKNGVALIAVDGKWRDGALLQAVMIGNLQDGVMKQDSRIKVDRTTKEKSAVVGYDVFDAKCTTAVKSLPPEIKKMFYGHYVKID